MIAFRHRAAAVVLLAATVLAACGDDDVSSSASDQSTSSTSSSTSSTAVPDGTTSPSTDDGSTAELDGEVIDIFPYAGATLAVVGVAADDVLNVRVGPGVDYDIAFTLEPLHVGATATGHNRQITGGAIWVELSRDGETGWANAAFLLQPGEVTDETATLYPNPGDLPTESTMEALANVVAGEVASTDGPTSTIVIVDGPDATGDLAEVTVDVIGLGDDAVGGLRLHLFAEIVESGLHLKTIEQQVLCSRGVDGGLCV